MNYWLVAAVALTVCLMPCAIVAMVAGPLSGLAALEVAGSLTTAVLLLFAESLRRQPFADLAVVFGVLSLIGAIVFARVLEHDL
jgi:multisubunit Na+/H+ antiporter MnhF subunit